MHTCSDRLSPRAPRHRQHVLESCSSGLGGWGVGGILRCRRTSCATCLTRTHTVRVRGVNLTTLACSRRSNRVCVFFLSLLFASLLLACTCPGRNGEEAIPMLVLNHSDKPDGGWTPRPQPQLPLDRSPPRLLEISPASPPLKLTDVSRAAGNYCSSLPHPLISLLPELLSGPLGAVMTSV